MRWIFGKKDAVALGLATSLLIVTVAVSGRGQPSVEGVLGLYRSSCCGELIVSPRSVTYERKTANVKFYHMKFGLTGYADQPIGPFYSVSGGITKPPVLYFDDANNFTVATYRGQTAHFTRVS